MESTGIYWKPVYHILEPSGMTVWICKLLLAGLLKPSYIPPRETTGFAGFDSLSAQVDRTSGIGEEPDNPDIGRLQY
jgi:hypothetical protein